MVHENQCLASLAGGFGQFPVEPLQALFAQLAKRGKACVAALHRVEKYQPPVAEVNGGVHETVPGHRFGKGRGVVLHIVVVADHQLHRHLQRPDQFLETPILFRCALVGEVAHHHQQVRVRTTLVYQVHGQADLAIVVDALVELV